MQQSPMSLRRDGADAAQDPRVAEWWHFTQRQSWPILDLTVGLWKRSPFLALIPYYELKQAFGWDAYKRVFAEYRDLRPDERPRTDDAKRDQWLIRMSRTVGHDLGPFFTSWSIPTSDEARSSVSDLPVWMPAGSEREGREED